MIGLDALMQVTALVLVALGLSIVFKRRSAATRHWLLASMLAAALMAPLLSVVMPRWQLPRRETQAPSATAQLSSAPPHGDAVTTTQTFKPVSAPGDRAVVPLTDAASAAAPWLVVVWVAGVLVMSATFIAGMARLRWLARRATRVDDGPWQEALQAETARSELPPVTLLQSQHPTLLVTWGRRRPRIILPAPAADWSADRIRVVMRHELAHIRRGDWTAQLVGEAVKVLHWYNPLVWIACRRLRDESELACDAALMQDGMSGLDYASELLELARALNVRRDSWTTALAMARPSSLERRVTAMLTEKIDRTPIARKQRALALCLAMALAMGVAGFSAAQSFSTLSGSVVDQLGGVVPNATLTLSSADAERKYQIRADAGGQYRFVGVVPGDYSLAAFVPGFKNASVPLAVTGQNVRRDLQLAIGSLEETISIVHKAGETPVAPRRTPPLTPEVSCTDTTTSGVIKQPTKIADMRPRYPENLGDAPRTDVIVLNAIIARDGTVREVIPKDANAQIDLANAAMDAVREWKYTPTFLNCVPIEVEMTVTVQFKAE